MATKSTDKTIWTLALVAVLLYAAFKYLNRPARTSSGGGYVPQGVGQDDYAPYQQPQNVPQFKFSLGGGGGGGSSPQNNTQGPDSPYGGPLSIADALQDGYAADGVSQDILAGFYNEGQGYGYYSDTTPQSIFDSIFSPDTSLDGLQLSAPDSSPELFDTSSLATSLSAPGAFVDSSDDGSTESFTSADADYYSFSDPYSYDGSGDITPVDPSMSDDSGFTDDGGAGDDDDGDDGE